MTIDPKSQISITLNTARALAVIKQGLHQRPALADKQTLLNTIRQIGLLQLDTVNVVARSHYLVMFSRVGLYDPTHLDSLFYPDHALFESWAHAACHIPVEDYDYFAPVIAARRNEPHRWYGSLADVDNPQAVLDAVLAEITAHGALSSSDFEDPRDQRGTWWDHKPAKRALNILYDRGQLMIDRRVNFKMYYDLPERVLPASAAPLSKTIEDYRRWATQRGVGCLGIATASQVADYYRLRTPETRTVLNTLAAEDAVVPVEVENWREPAYILPADLPLADEIAQGLHQPTLTTLLSPFDNLTWNRDRLAALFGFDYRIELYTPQPQRKYGYYVLPILHNGRMVGRLDPKADRKTKTLLVHAIYLEPGVEITDELVAGLAESLREFMVFHGSEKVIIGRSEPENLREAVQRQVGA